MTTLLKPWHFPLGPRPADGFTLLELLIAIAISAIVLVAINTLFFGALHLRQKAAEAAEQTLPTDRAIMIIKKDLLAIVPPGDLAGSFGSDSPGIGMSQPPLLELFSASGAVTAEQPWADVQKIDYSLMAPTNRNNSGGRDLIRGVTRNLLATDPIAPENHAILEDVQNLQFSYYDGTNWNDTWSTMLSNIPIAIKVSIDFAVAKGSTAFKPSVQFLVPIVAWSTTNSITNQISN